MIDVRRLAVLREVARHGSFNRAAAALRLTPSAVSQQVAALERALGTAVVITPVWEITRGKQVIKISDPETVDPTLQRLYDMIQGIQYGDLPDRHGWCHEVK